jgi:hypothetical protein
VHRQEVGEPCSPLDHHAVERLGGHRMNESRMIPAHLQDEVNTMPEYSQGVVRIRVTLDDASRFNDVFVAWGSEIVKVGESEDVPLNASRIVSVER